MAQDVTTLKNKITSALDFLPPESLRLLRGFVAFLRSRAEQSAPQGRIVKLGGLWAGTPEITEEDIAEARREMWGHFGEREKVYVADTHSLIWHLQRIHGSRPRGACFSHRLTMEEHLKARTAFIARSVARASSLVANSPG